MRWTTHAADDLARIVSYIRKDNPEASRRVAKTIFDGVASLRTFPQRGRISLATDTRELVFAPWPYLAVYEISQGQVHILRIGHASQDWPRFGSTLAPISHIWSGSSGATLRCSGLSYSAASA